MSLREIYDSPEVRKIIQQSPQMWDFCKGCKIGCPYEVSAYRNSPLTAIRGALDFLKIPLARNTRIGPPVTIRQADEISRIWEERFLMERPTLYSHGLT